MTEQEIQEWIDHVHLIHKAIRWAIFDKMPIGVDHVTDIIDAANGDMFCAIRYFDGLDTKAKTRHTLVPASDIAKAMAKHYNEEVTLWHRSEEEE